MPQVVDQEKNKRIVCYHEAFKLMLESQYGKVVALFIDEPIELIHFINTMILQGDTWAANLSSVLNEKWKIKGKSEYYMTVLDQYIMNKAKDKDEAIVDFVEKLKILRIELQIDSILKGVAAYVINPCD